MKPSIEGALVMLDPTAGPWREPTADELFTLTLYAKPSDYPEHYVLRAWYTSAARGLQPAGASLLFPNARDAERFVAWAFPQLVFMGRAMDDEPQIVGCWL